MVSRQKKVYNVDNFNPVYIGDIGLISGNNRLFIEIVCKAKRG